MSGQAASIENFGIDPDAIIANAQREGYKLQGSAGQSVFVNAAHKKLMIGAVHSHARRGLAEGVAAAELEHVALLAVTTLGWPQAVRGLTWIKDVTQPLSDD